MGTAAVVGIAVAGLALSAYGTVAAGQAASDNAKYQSQVAKNNADIANQNAEYAAKAGEVAATEQGLKGAAVSGRIKAAIGANNVDVNTGSAADVQETQKETNQLNTEQTMNNALLKAYGYRTQSTNDTAQSGLLSSQADQDITGSEIGAAGSLLSGASSIPTKFNSSTVSGGSNDLSVGSETNFSSPGAGFAGVPS